MAKERAEIRFPSWAPPELLALHAELLPKALESRKQIAALKDCDVGEYDWKAAIEFDAVHIGHVFIGPDTRLQILEALLTTPQMQSVWKSLARRNASFKPQRRHLTGGLSQPGNLFGACVRAQEDWLEAPKRTKVKGRELYRDISAQALGLAELLLEVNSRDFHSVPRFIDAERRKEFIHGLERNEHEIWYGFEGYLDHLLGELIPSIPAILLELHKRALEEMETPLAVPQPNSPSAKLRYLVRTLSTYFKAAYGTPLHAHVAAVVSAVLKVDVDEDRVRALIRLDQQASKKAAGKKMTKLLKESDG